MKTLFQPNLVLCREPDGEYTMHSVTLAPNSAYGGGRAERGAPPNVRLLPEVEPILLHIRHRPGRYLPVPKPVRHCIGDLKLGERSGKTALTVFAMVGDAVVGSSTLDVRHLGGVQVGDGPDRPIDTSDWYAWMNVMPGAPRSLHVSGVVTVPTPGYEARLAPAAPQGINPRDLILDLTLARKPGVWIQVVSQIPVRYDVPDYAGNYDSVLVRLPDGSGIPLEIEEVQ